MNKLDAATRIQIVSALIEGMAIRATCRMTGAAKGTVLKLVAALGTACEEYQDKAIRGIKSKRIESIQCDEIWSFVGAKAKNVPHDKQGSADYGDVWTWTAIDADSKLNVSWLVGGRDAGTAWEFIRDLAARVAGRIQLTTDGKKLYLEAV